MGKTIRIYGFPYNEPALRVKDFLEHYTGTKTIYALVIKPPNNGGLRALSFVQFTTSRSAQLVIGLITNGLFYKGFILRDCSSAKDIVTKPRILLLSAKQATLRFGCQTSPKKFSILWESEDVTADFESDPVKISFFLSHGTGKYKIELSRNSIWQIQLHRPRRGTVKFLLIQIFGGPRIFEKLESSHENGLENASSSYFMDSADDEWIRTTDFTPCSCIGQSSSVCLELPSTCGVPDFRKNFIDFKDHQDDLAMERVSPFSRSSSYLVPILHPPEGTPELPFKTLFKLSALVQNGCVPGPKIDAEFFSLLDPRKIPEASIESGLDKIFHSKECCYDPHRYLLDHYERPRAVLPSPPLEPGLVRVYKALITPATVYFCGPEITVSNRVLRRYRADADRFLRVSFVDEDTEKLHSMNLSHRTKGYTRVYHRIVSVLRNGVRVGDRRFEFLAYAPSQLRENSVWMFASRPGLDAADIRRWMGDFARILNVPKYAARLGQSFSSSTETAPVDDREVEVIPDVESPAPPPENRYVFSDGIGKISSEFAEEVAGRCGIRGRTTPSAFQIRFGGYKGVVAVDPTSMMKLSLRKSMCKYPSELRSLDVLSWTKPLPCFLNRQVILLLSTLGVDDAVFTGKQAAIVDQLNTMTDDPEVAWDALEFMSQGETAAALREMLRCGYDPKSEPFLVTMMHAFRASKMFELRSKSRIFVPEARQLMGCLDETATLEYGQVFVQVSSVGSHRAPFSLLLGRDDPVGGERIETVVVTSTVAVAKNPCLHPGDVRVLSAVDVPSLHHMVDCVVFPQKGERPHPNECSGSDLDGDLYFVTWDRDLIPPNQERPMDYTPPRPVLVDHPVTIEEVEEYFVNYMVNDCLGMISNAHLAFAGKDPMKALNPSCVELAMLHSVAVDFAKTGVPARIPAHLQAKEFPDFMEKRDKPTYLSRLVLGKLFREVKEVASQAISFTPQMEEGFYDTDMEVDGFRAHLDAALVYKLEYDTRLWNMMEYYKVKTEGEMFSGYMSKSYRKYMDIESIDVAVRSLKAEVRDWFAREADGVAQCARASAWYHVTYHPSLRGRCKVGRSNSHFLTFPWCIYDRLIHIKRLNKARRESQCETILP